RGARERSALDASEADHDHSALPLLDLERARLAWRRARSFTELCRLGAAFVAGECAFFPGWGWRSLDDESAHIANELAAFHRAGFLTVASQPGRAFLDERGRAIEQRAFVCGFADDRAARALRALAPHGELSISLFRRGESGGVRTPVSTHGGVE